MHQEAIVSAFFFSENRDVNCFWTLHNGKQEFFYIAWVFLCPLPACADMPQTVLQHISDARSSGRRTGGLDDGGSEHPSGNRNDVYFIGQGSTAEFISALQRRLKRLLSSLNESCYNYWFTTVSSTPSKTHADQMKIGFALIWNGRHSLSRWITCFLQLCFVLFSLQAHPNRLTLRFMRPEAAKRIHRPPSSVRTLIAHHLSLAMRTIQYSLWQKGTIYSPYSSSIAAALSAHRRFIKIANVLGRLEARSAGCSG